MSQLYNVREEIRLAVILRKALCNLSSVCIWELCNALVDTVPERVLIFWPHPTCQMPGDLEPPNQGGEVTSCGNITSYF